MKKDIVQYISNADVCVGVIPEIGGTIVFLSKNNSENLIKSDPALWDLEKRPNVDALRYYDVIDFHIVEQTQPDPRTVHRLDVLVDDSLYQLLFRLILRQSIEVG